MVNGKWKICSFNVGLDDMQSDWVCSKHRMQICVNPRARKMKDRPSIRRDDPKNESRIRLLTVD